MRYAVRHGARAHVQCVPALALCRWPRNFHARHPCIRTWVRRKPCSPRCVPDRPIVIRAHWRKQSLAYVLRKTTGMECSTRMYIIPTPIYRESPSMNSPRVVYTCSASDLKVRVPGSTRTTHVQRYAAACTQPSPTQEQQELSARIAWLDKLIDPSRCMSQRSRDAVNHWWIAKTRNTSRHPYARERAMENITENLRLERERLQVSLDCISTTHTSSPYPARNLSR